MPKKNNDGLDKLEELLKLDPKVKDQIDWGMLEWASKKALHLNKAFISDTPRGTPAERKADYKFRRNRNHRWQ